MTVDQDELAAIVARIFEASYSPATHRGLARNDARLGDEADRQDVEWVESILPFLDRAVVADPDANADDAPKLDGGGELPIAVCVVDSELRLIRATPRAHRLLRGASVLSLTGGRVAPPTESLRRDFEGVIMEVVRTGASRSATWAGPEGADQEFLVAPMPGNGEARAMVVMNVEIGAFDRFCSTLERAYGLTASEAEVAAHLAQGRSIEEIAAAKGTSANTVRTQVKQAFAKTGTRRQGELIARVLNESGAWLRLIDGTDDEPRGYAHRADRLGHLDRPRAAEGILELEDGRHLGYGDYGPESGRPVVVCHHLLGSRRDAPGDPALLERLDVRLLVPERPGIGRSTPVDKRSLMACAEDVAQLVGALGVPRFHVLGTSSGGPHAAACAALLPDRVRGVGLAASMMPWDELPAGTPIDLTQRFLVGMARRWPAGVRSLLARRYHAQLDRPEAALADLISRGNAADARLFEQAGLAETRLRDLRAAAESPPEVFADELVSLFRPWGFAVRDLEVPVVVWHGAQDDFFSFDQAKAMTRGLREGRGVFRDDWGHFFFYREWASLLQDLLDGDAERTATAAH